MLLIRLEIYHMSIALVNIIVAFRRYRVHVPMDRIVRAFVVQMRNAIVIPAINWMMRRQRKVQVMSRIGRSMNHRIQFWIHGCGDRFQVNNSFQHSL